MVGQCLIFFEDGVVFGESGGFYVFEFVGGQYWFEQVGGVYNVVGCCFGIDDGVNFIDEQNGVVLFVQF